MNSSDANKCPSFLLSRQFVRKGRSAFNELSFISIITLHTIACVYFSFISLSAWLWMGHAGRPTARVCVHASVLRRWVLSSLSCAATPAAPNRHRTGARVLRHAQQIQSLLPPRYSKLLASCWGHSRRPLRVNARNSHTRESTLLHLHASPKLCLSHTYQHLTFQFSIFAFAPIFFLFTVLTCNVWLWFT